MGGGLEIIILAMVAGFIALRLVSVLGRHTDDDQNRQKPQNQPRKTYGLNTNDRPDAQDAAANRTDAGAQDTLPPPVVKPAGGTAVDRSTPLGQTLSRIMVADRSFNPDGFVTGARGAYEMIIEAFAAGDRETLEPLLNDEVYRNFDAAISAREEAGQTAETKVVDIEEAEITEALLDDGLAEVTVTFKADMVNVVRDSEERIVEGNPSDVETVTDIWTFARQVKSRDPNWQLIATETEG